MFFRVQNLGPLRNAEVDLSKDLIVLAGPNNSGKTYLAWSVYGLHSERLRGSDTLNDPVLDAFVSPTHREIDVVKNPPNWENVLRDIGGACQVQLTRIFAADPDAFTNAKVILRQTAESAHRVGTTLNEDRPLVLAELDLSAEQRCDLLTAVVWAALFPNAIVFPAERIALNIFAKELALKHSELISDLMEGMFQKDKNPKEAIRRRAGRYAWPIRDNLQVANDLANLSKNQSAFAELADDLERAVLGGQISVSEFGEILFGPHSANEANEQRLPVHLTASVVKSLSSLVFYFRHLAQPGDFIIIDEPELNLHPDNQRKITRILAKAVRLGFKIMMSTHSDYVLRELNHLIMLNKLPEDEAKTLGYDPAFAIDPNRIGVYLFNEGTAQPVPIEETGFSIKTIDDVVNQLNIDEQRLYTRILKY